MNSRRTETDPSADPALDRLLKSHTSGDALTPSSGFAASVMEAVHAEAVTPEPIPFPWRRAVPGLVILIAMVVAFGVWIVRQWAAAARTGVHTQAMSSLSEGSIPTALNNAELTVVWIALAIALSLVTVFASLRLASRG